MIQRNPRSGKYGVRTMNNNTNNNKQNDIKILVFDDNERNLYTYNQILARPDREIITVKSGEEGLRLLFKHDISLMLMDVQMPDMNGFETAKLIFSREQTKDIPVIFVSAVYQEQDFVNEGFALGAVDYVTKPIDSFLLRNKVEVFLRLYHQNRVLVDKQEDINKMNNYLKKKTIELKKMQAQIVHNAKLASLGVMSSGLAHELNNPLQFIMGFNESLKAVYEDFDQVTYEQVKDEIEEIDKNCHRMNNIIKHFREFSRQDDSNFKRLKINDVIHKSFILFKEQLRLRNIKMELDLSNQDPEVNGNNTRLEQVFTNLISNSRDAISSSSPEEGGLLKVISKTKEDSILIDFMDNGPGIKKANIDRIFDPFYTTKEVGKGTGLGLSISFGILQEHKGDINCVSTSDQGTTFQIKLPLYNSPPNTPPQESEVI